MYSPAAIYSATSLSRGAAVGGTCGCSTDFFLDLQAPKVNEATSRSKKSDLFPLNGSRRFGADIIHYAVNSFDFVDDFI